MKISKITSKVSTALLSASIFLATAPTTYAQSNFNPAPIPLIGTEKSLKGLIQDLVNIALAVIGIIAVIYLIWGGVTYITAGGDAEKAGKGRIAITNAIIGIVIILAALVIYNGVIKSVTGGTLR